jgi:hypothetical protein
MLSLIKSACFSIAALRFARITLTARCAQSPGMTREYVEKSTQDEPDRIDICVQLPDGSVLRSHLDRNNLLEPVMVPLPSAGLL